MNKSGNTQMFALKAPPPETIEVAGAGYKLVRVFKHDFWAATCLYELDTTACNDIPRVVVKFGRTQAFCGLPLNWYGRWLRSHEEAIYSALSSVEGVPRWVGCIGETGYAIEYIEGKPLDHVHSPPTGFFESLREIFDAVHARGIGYSDANKRSNIIVADDGRPFLVDYQISIRRRDDLPWPLDAIARASVRYIVQRDLYHLYKHKRRMSPDEITDDERAISYRRGLLHSLHRNLTNPYRWLRRRILKRQYRKGALVSPTEHLEDHYQPEKATWRYEDKD